MWHLYLNAQGLHEICFVNKGRYIVGSKQGYSSRGKALNSLRSLNNPIAGSMIFQDDTKEKPVVYKLDNDKGSKPYPFAHQKPKPKYIPS